MVPGSDQLASLPPHYAFVAQLAADTRVETGQRHGRVEHVISQYATQQAFTSFFSHNKGGYYV
jgi:hypothetical protein